MPLLVGGVIIMALISYSEDRLKDPNKETLKHWDKNSPLRNALKTAAQLKYGINISSEKNNEIIRDFNKELKTLGKGIVEGKYDKKKVNSMLKELNADMKTVKNEKDLLKTIKKHDLLKPKGILKNARKSKAKTRSRQGTETSAPMPSGLYGALEGSVEKKRRRGIGPSLDGGKRRTKKRMSRKKSKKVQRSKRK